MMNRRCVCEIDSALYACFGRIRCQYCDGEVRKDRAHKFLAYNGIPEKAIREKYWRYIEDKDE